MHLLLGIYLAALAMAASHVLAVPTAVLIREQDVPSMRPGSSPESTLHQAGKQSAAAAAAATSSSPPHADRLPGVNHKPVPATLGSGADANGTAGGASSTTIKPAAVFGQKCTQLTLLGDGRAGQSTLQAACLDEEMEVGARWLTSLNLNHCLGNEGGKLIFKER
ncbi:hypothetical protein LLEC1_03219 [Akanthomyces lecanii]|uniref:Cyanovirin-N domain-containing protein n=1 Tax=Cordyceps confragosa TaxID=2714763 RepID=A0A179I6B5_CORDF|nr:hypothetical protein LLEC1_03219 [Akanthomyces lecanii]